MKRGETMVTTCSECHAPAKAVKYVGKGVKGMFWVCDNGHRDRQCNRVYKTVAGK